MADLLLVNPLFLKDDPVERALMTPYFPLGILYVAAAVRQAGYDVAVFDGMFAAGDADFVAVLKEHQPKVVAFGVLATVRQAAFRLAALAKKNGAKVVMGGADPTARPATYLQFLASGEHVVDVVTVGESEETMVSLMAMLPEGWSPESLSTLLGIAYLDEAGVPTETARRPLLADVDAIPLPARDLVDYAPYRKAWREHHGHFALSIIATRGCRFSCAWCQKAVFGRLW